MDHKTLPDEFLLSRKEVEQKFGLSRRFLEIAAVSGTGPKYVKIGRSVRYQVSDLRDWIAAHRVNSTSEGDLL